MIKPGGSGSHNVYQFRRGEPASLKLPADSGTARQLPVHRRAVSNSIPSDSPQDDHAARLFHPRERIHEGLAFAARRHDDIWRGGKHSLWAAVFGVAILGIALGLG